MNPDEMVLVVRQTTEFFLQEIKKKSPEKYEQLILEFKEEETS